MKTRREVVIEWGNTIQNALNKLKQLSNLYDNEIEYYCKFNGYELTSSMTLNDATMLVAGVNEETLNDLYKQLSNTIDTPKFDIIKDYRSRARGIIREDKLKQWDDIVPIRVDDIYNGSELGSTLTLVKMLDIDDASFTVVKAEFISQNHSGISTNLMFQLLKEFSIYGEEFVDFILE